MNVLFLGNAASIHTVRWVNTLHEKGIKVILVSLKNHKDEKDLINRNVKKYNLPIGGTVGYYLNKVFVKNIVSKEKINLVNAHYASGYGTLARMSCFHPIILSVWGADIYSFPRKNILCEKIVKRNLEFADYIASTSICMAEVTKDLLISNKEITITPFGVDTDNFKPIKLNRNENEFIFGTVKTLDEKYGIEFMIRCFHEFCKLAEYNNINDINFKYLIYGSGPCKDLYRNLIDELNLNDKVFLCGYVENDKLPMVLNKFDVFLLGSQFDSESFGVAAVEAMSCELPVIATDVDGFKEVIDHEITGVIVNRSNANNYVNYMLKLFLDSKLRLEFGKNARIKVLNEYNWSNNVDEMISLYKKASK